MTAEHEVRVTAQGVGYGGVDVYIECRPCKWIEPLPTRSPTLADLIEAANAHTLAGEWQATA